MPSVLLVHGDPDRLAALRADLEPLGLELEAFVDPRQALLRGNEAEFQLVLTAYSLPGLDGLALTGRLRRRQPALATIVLGSPAELRTIRRALFESGDAPSAPALLPSPCPGRMLRTAVRKALAVPQAQAVAPPADTPRGALATLEARLPGITKPGETEPLPWASTYFDKL